MKKLMLALGAAIGFVLGSRAGRQPYERIESTVKGLSTKPSVRDAVATTRTAMLHATDVATSTIGDKIEATAQHATEAVDKSADKVIDALGADHRS